MMRKVKLQMQLSVDGFVAGPNGEMDWMVWDWDDQLKNYVTELSKPIDTILLGRKLAEGFIDAWQSRAVNPPAEEEWFIRKMNESPKVVFSETLKQVKWKNTRLAENDLATEIKLLKQQSGEDIITYGGASFAGSLISKNLIDEYHLFINPTTIGNGLTIFNKLENRLNLRLVNTTPTTCGIVVLCYQPK